MNMVSFSLAARRTKKTDIPVIRFRACYRPTDACTDMSSLPPSPHRDMRTIFQMASTTSGLKLDDMPPLSCPLLPSHCKNAWLVGNTPTLCTPMQGLLKFPVLWLARSLGYWNDLRLTWFKEVSKGIREVARALTRRRSAQTISPT